ncbi:MAG: sugar transferase [Planctomycetes bacterium]|nr:sugar transferase [Planctomycetota bacterium]
MSRTLWARGGKRVFDLVVGVLLVIVLSPVLLAAAVAIKSTSRGPLLFKHRRAGRGGVIFGPYKFRTMTHQRKSDAVELVPLDHPDITRVGRFLRRTKIDELPQVFNAIKGEMALVGPRPDLPDHIADYTPFQRQRLAVRPGLTGLAQVNGAAAISWDERIRYDVYYIAHCGCWMDLDILLKTVGVILRGEARHARGFEQSPYHNPDEPLGWDRHQAEVSKQTQDADAMPGD